jgi:hypothetical protein
VCYRWMYQVERYLHTLKGYVKNKAQPKGSIEEGYVSEECLTFCSNFSDNISTKLNRSECHESAAGSEPPSGISIFGMLDYSRKGSIIEIISHIDIQRMRFYILSNCEEVSSWIT